MAVRSAWRSRWPCIATASPPRSSMPAHAAPRWTTSASSPSRTARGRSSNGSVSGRAIPHTAITTIHISHQGGLGRTRLTAADEGVPALGYVLAAGDLAASLDAALAADRHSPSARTRASIRNPTAAADRLGRRRGRRRRPPSSATTASTRVICTATRRRAARRPRLGTLHARRARSPRCPGATTTPWC